jgi:hypothetical protein
MDVHFDPTGPLLHVSHADDGPEVQAFLHRLQRLANCLVPETAEDCNEAFRRLCIEIADFSELGDDPATAGAERLLIWDRVGQLLFLQAALNPELCRLFVRMVRALDHVRPDARRPAAAFSPRIRDVLTPLADSAQGEVRPAATAEAMAALKAARWALIAALESRAEAAFISLGLDTSDQFGAACPAVPPCLRDDGGLGADESEHRRELRYRLLEGSARLLGELVHAEASAHTLPAANVELAGRVMAEDIVEAAFSSEAPSEPLGLALTTFLAVAGRDLSEQCPADVERVLRAILTMLVSTATAKRCPVPGKLRFAARDLIEAAWAREWCVDRFGPEGFGVTALPVARKSRRAVAREAAAEAAQGI